MFSQGTLWAGAISGGVTLLRDAGAHRSGEINDQEYAVHTTANLTSTLGLMAGFEYGAYLGSALLPGAGTLIGTIVGGIIGDRLGQVVGQQSGAMLFSAPSGQKVATQEQMKHSFLT